MVLQQLWDFVKRHRRKFITAGVIVGGGYAALRYMQWKVKRLQDQEMEEALLLARKRHHFECNQRTCNTTALSLLPVLRDALKKKMDTESLTSKLKSKPANKIEIWEHLKILSFTRTLVSVYCDCLLVVILRVQVNVVGGYLFLDNVQTKDSGTGQGGRLDTRTQQSYMGMIHYLMDDGLSALVSKVKAAVEREMIKYSLKHKLSFEDVHSMVGRVRQEVEGSDSKLSELVQFPSASPEPESSSTERPVTLSQLVDDTAAILDSSDFRHVLRTALDQGFAQFEHLLDNFYDTLDNSPRLNGDNGRAALAKVIPVVNGLIQTTCSDAPNRFVQDLLLLHPVVDFGANIYESFSQPSGSS